MSLFFILKKGKYQKAFEYLGNALTYDPNHYKVGEKKKFLSYLFFSKCCVKTLMFVGDSGTVVEKPFFVGNLQLVTTFLLKTCKNTQGPADT